MKRSLLLFLMTILTTISLQAQDTLSASIDLIVPVSCFGGNDGSAGITVQGTAPFSFQWSHGDTTQTVTNLTAGSYAVTVMDALGDQVELSGIEIGQPDELVLELTFLLLPDCLGQPGAAAVEGSGGTPPYSYLWSDGQTENTLVNAQAGSYTVIITDDHGCTRAMDIELNLPVPQVSIQSSGDLTCTQQEVQLDGSVAGSSNFVFEWTTNGGTFVSSTDNLIVAVNAAGTYQLEVTDTLNGCSATTSIEVLEDIQIPVVDAGSDTIVACTNTILQLQGSAASGNSFSYAWEALDGGNIQSGADTESPVVDHAGSFVLTVTNIENGCISNDTVQVTGLNTPPTATLSGGSLTCAVSTIQLLVVADTIHSLFEWTGPNGFATLELNPVIAEAGIYTFVMTDTLTTCSASFKIEVKDLTTPPAVSVQGGVLTCQMPDLTITAVTSSADAIFEWTGPNAYYSTSQDIIVSEPGDYTLLLTDTLTGCTATEMATVDSDFNAPIADAGAGGEINCLVTIWQMDGTGSSQNGPYTYLWSTLDGHIVEGEETLFPEVDAAGTYQLVVTDTVNGCTSADEVTITGNLDAPVIEALGGIFTCFEGGIQLLGLFDTTGVSFQWEGPGAFVSLEQNPFVTKAGIYTLTVTDYSNGCSATAEAVVEQEGITPELMTTGGTITCSNPEVTLTVEAQIEGIVWSWASDNGFTATEQNPVTGQPGIYTVLAIDTVYGCIALDTAYVTIDTVAPVADAGSGASLDCHTSSVQLNGTVSAGTDFTFSWTTTDGHFVAGDDTLTPEVDAAGTYTLTVTNLINGCTSSSDVVINQIPDISLDLSTGQATCHGTATGSATVIASGGTGNYSYAWSSGQTASQATGLVAGTYTLTVSDDNGCSEVLPFVINQPDLLQANASATGQSLSGIDDGTATALPTGGTAPYSFDWSNGDTAGVLGGLAPGPYTVIVTDDNGCTAIETVNVNEFPCVLTAMVEGTDVSCFGGNNGTASISLENAILPLNIVWSNGDSLLSVSGLEAGLYQVTVSDSTLCKNELTVSIGQPSALVLTEIYHVDVVCPTEQTGFVIAGTTGGIQPYQYNWSNGSTSPIANGLGTGDYQLTVTDGQDCTHLLQTTILATDTEAPVLLLQNAAVALDENGQVSLDPAVFDAGTSDNCGSFSLSVNPADFDCTQLGDQSVTIIAADQNGNQVSAIAHVTIIDLIVPELNCPDPITVSECSATVSFASPDISDNCQIDASLLEQTAGLPSGATFPLGTTVQTFSYTDAAGNTGTCSFDVTVVKAISIAPNSLPVSCFGSCDGQIELSLSGGILPYQIEWNNGETGTSLSGLCAGTYTATISDNSGCTETVDLEVTEPSQLEIAAIDVQPTQCAEDMTGSIQTVITGGTAPYDLIWSDGTSGDLIENVLPGQYTLTATDANGCTQTLSETIGTLDTEGPVLQLMNISVALDASGQIELQPEWFDAGSSDNCSIVTWELNPVLFDCQSLGTQEVIITAWDGSGNSSSSSVFVTVTDETTPTVTCPTDILTGFCNATISYPSPTVSDNCTIELNNLLLVEGLPSGSTFPSGTTLQRYEYTDAAGNTGICSFSIIVSEAAQISSTISDVSCHASCDGSIILAISGTAEPFEVTWNDGQSGIMASDLCAGTYEATITDMFNCIQFFTAEITEPLQLSVVTDSKVNDIGQAGIGSIDITVSGGTSPYSYNWQLDGQPFSTTEDLENLFAGTYSVVVMDANGCEVSVSAIIIENVTGTEENLVHFNGSLYPNPATDHTWFTIPGTMQAGFRIQLIDQAGRQVRHFDTGTGHSEFRMNLEGLAPGVYLVRFESTGITGQTRLVILQ